MRRFFIFSICSTCGLPGDIIEPCKELGYNAFPYTNFHGELDGEGTERLRQDLIKKLREDGKNEKADAIEKNTKVLVCYFNQNAEYGIEPVITKKA
jgi:hypothetical protein